MRWLPAFLWMTVIFYLSHQPASNLESMLPFFHKIFPAMKSFNGGHFVAYFILAMTFYWALGEKYANLKGKLNVIIICLLYGATDEYHQSFVEGRYPDYVDLRNDGIGAAIAMLFVSIPPIHRYYIKLLHSKIY
jgi:VanZ family protein